MFNIESKEHNKAFLESLTNRIKEYCDYLRANGGLRESLEYHSFNVASNEAIIFFESIDNELTYLHLDINILLRTSEEWKECITDIIKKKKTDKEREKREFEEAQAKKREQSERATYERLKKKFGV